MTERETIEIERLRWRGLRPEEACTACGGAGARVYPNGATWRGGAGPSKPQRDLCDRCWGSGNRFEPWADLRALLAGVAAEKARNGVTELCGQLAAHGSLRTEVLVVADLLDGFALGALDLRRAAAARSVLAGSVAAALAAILRKGASPC